MAYERYAIYWVPGSGTPLAAFARDWFGRDTETGDPHTPRAFHCLDAGLAERATASPRRYGCHATMKAPFPLRDGAGEAELAEALGAFCLRRRRARSGTLRLQRLWRYLALTITEASAEVDWLADQCVTHFDSFRAALSEADMARRPRDLPLDARRNLEQFGYTDVFGRFQFHITLAGPLEASELASVEAALAPVVEPFTREPFIVADLCLCGDPGQGGLFEVVARHPLMR